MTSHVKDADTRDTGESTVPATAIANVLHAVDRHTLARVPSSELDLELDLEWYREADTRLPYHQLAELYDAAARWTGDPYFGLHVGASIDERRFDLVGYLVRTSASIQQVFEVLERYLPLGPPPLASSSSARGADS